MTEIAVNEAPATGVALSDVGNGTDLAAWVNDLGNAYTLAERICRTPFAPRDFQGKPEAAAVAILHGKSLGLDPLASMSSIFVVSGRPGLYSKAMHAIVLAAGHQVWVESESPQEVVVKGKRKGADTVSTSRWTPERAKKAGYDTNKKYLTEPIAMLRARAIGDVCRVVAPDVLAGLAYNEADVELMDPIEDMGEAPAASVEDKPKRTVKRKAAPAPSLPDIVHDAPEPEPEAAPEADPEVVDEAASDTAGEIPMCTPDQWTHLTVALKGAGHKTKPSMGAAVNGFLQRETGGPQDITADEANRMLEHFTNLVAEALPAAEGDDAAWPEPAPVPA
ncbi:hypothetical protein [Arthrobacter sp. VKM Ac-2550]|uniref:hypothetical protein n=1 Tax=Crystallibacter permensis TaxID=1938888 RepID=UPI002227EE75|nr:hypothetical protein [Arthrobacter sp. VKM Ac-2550]MCW2132929.1 hypothetical protein [Arthrobacter sp. VKM Ac-2550]